jgi:hypothetical protein
MNTYSTNVVADMTGSGAATPGSGVAASLRSRRMPLFFRRAFAFLLGRRQLHAAEPCVAGPSEIERCSAHEAGHVLIARIFNTPVHSVTTIPNIEMGYSGQAMIGNGEPVARTMAEHESHVLEIVRTVDQHLPRHGEDPGDAAPWLLCVHTAVTELLAGAAAEVDMYGRADDGRSRGDYHIAWLKARTICSTDASTQSFLEFALTEAIELITPYRPVLTALAEELTTRRELNGAEVDQIITAAVAQQAIDCEMARREAWGNLTKRAVAFEKDLPAGSG